MRRRTLLFGAASTLLAAGCSDTEGSQPVGVAPVTIPEGTTPIASWVLEGGVAAPGVLALRPPHLVVYPEGPVIADAAYRSDLTADDLTTLVSDLSESLRGPDAAKRRDGFSPQAQAPTTVLTVHSPKGTYSVRAPSLDELRAKQAYPEPLYSTRDRIAAIYQTVVSSGQPYSAERVRLVVTNSGLPAGNTQPGNAQPGDTQRWPATVPSPEGYDKDGVCVMTAHGDQGRDIVRSLTRDLDLNSAWPTYQLSDGTTVLATWRYLLPDER
jgi:hypothetical protein